MATIRAYTTIEQSRKLAEILPIDSADMQWFLEEDYGIVQIKEGLQDWGGDCTIPCWSLAALFKVISNIFKYNLDYNGTSFILMVGDFEVSNKTAVDACVAMIEKLHEFKML